MSNFDNFIEAIKSRRVVTLKFNSIEKGIITRKCIPFDFGPSNWYKDDRDRYHFYDLNSPDGSHNLSILPEQVLAVELTKQTFEPEDYITWTPSWFIKRDWGKYS